jgi:hypothetical protein
MSTLMRESVNSYLQRIKSVLPTFQRFGLGSGAFDADERDYKFELIHLFQSNLASGLAAAHTTRSMPDGVAIRRRLRPFLTMNPASEPWLPPYEEGYRLAEDVRDELGTRPEQLRIDIMAVLEELSIRVEEVELDSNSIRGVAVAGNGFSPAILVNTKSAYNVNDAGRRFYFADVLRGARGRTGRSSGSAGFRAFRVLFGTELRKASFGQLWRSPRRSTSRASHSEMAYPRRCEIMKERGRMCHACR